MPDHLSQLSKWMYQQGIRGKDLAQQMDLDPSYVWRIFHNERPITDAFIGRFATVFGFAAAEAVFGNGQQPAPVDMTTFGKGGSPAPVDMATFADEQAAARSTTSTDPDA